MKKIFFKLLIIIVFVFQFSESNAQSDNLFTEIVIDEAANFHNLVSAQLGDYDNDGDQDILVVDSMEYIYIYENELNSFSQAASLPILYGVSSEYVRWFDYDNDGDLDVLMVGDDSPGIKLFKNNSGAFSEITIENLIAAQYGSVNVGDFNNDGLKDLLIAGANVYDDSNPDASLTQIIQNDGTAFTEVYQGLITGSDGSAVWGDFDNDNYLDIVLCGSNHDLNEEVSKVYKNTGGSFTEIYPNTLAKEEWSRITCGDYDNDGLLDILLFGSNWDEYDGGDSFTKLYKNLGNGFSEVTAASISGSPFSSAWGDYDNDGDLDVILSPCKIYRNDGGDSFTQVYEDLVQSNHGRSCWGDYDNDGDLDIISVYGNLVIHENNLESKNYSAIAPGNASSYVSGTEVTLTWNKTTDTETPQDGLSYNIEVYKDDSKKKAKVFYTKIERIQYSENGYTLKNLTEGNYYWKVQAFDTGLQGGEFSEEQSFVIGASNENTYYEEDSICDGEVYTFGNQELTAAGEYTETFTASDNSDSTVVLTLTVNPVYDLTENVSVCEGSSYTFADGTVESDITAQIEHTSNLQTIFGCDSIITTTVDVIQGETYNLAEEYDICEGEDYTFPDGTILNDIQDTTVYTSNLESVGGCDSIIETTLNIKPLPVPIFTYVCDSVFVIFTNETEYGENYLWHFGDGESSFLTNPTHTYPELGKFEVRMKALNECGSTYFTDSILVEYTEPTGLNDIANQEIKVYPNPASERIYIDYDQELRVEFYNLVGIKVLEAKETEINISDLQPGTYLVLIRNEFGELIQKVKVIKR